MSTEQPPAEQLPQTAIDQSIEFQQAFKEAARPLIQFLAERCPPHASAIVTYDTAELVEGEALVRTKEFVRD